MRQMWVNDGMWCEVDVTWGIGFPRANVVVDVTVKDDKGAEKEWFEVSKTVYKLPWQIKKQVNLPLLHEGSGLLAKGDTVEVRCGSFLRRVQVLGLDPV
jgi:hypothetical protein